MQLLKSYVPLKFRKVLSFLSYSTKTVRPTNVHGGQNRDGAVSGDKT